MQLQKKLHLHEEKNLHLQNNAIKLYFALLLQVSDTMHFALFAVKEYRNLKVLCLNFCKHTVTVVKSLKSKPRSFRELE